MVLFPQVLQVCCFSAVIVTVNSYVLFAANLEDFRNLAKRFISEELAGKLTKLVSQTSLSHKKKRNENKSSEEDTALDISKGVDRKMEYIYDDDKSATEVTVNLPREEHERMRNKYSTFGEIISSKGKTGPIEIILDDYEKLSTHSNVRKKPVEKLIEMKKMQNGDAKNRPVKNNHSEKSFENAFKNDNVKNDDTKKISALNLREENDRTQNNYAKIRPVNNQFGNYELQNENRKKRPIINKLQNNEMQNSYTNKSPFVNEFENDEVENVNRKIRPAKNAYENDKTQVDKYENVDLDFTTYATAKSKRYRTVKRLPASKSWFEQAQSYEKRKDVSLVNKNSRNPKELRYEKEEIKNVQQRNTEEENSPSGERNKRKDIYNFSIRESNYDKKTTTESPGDREKFEPIKSKLVNKEDRIYGRYVHQRTTKNEDVTESDLIYEKVLLNKKKDSEEENVTVKKSYSYFEDESYKLAQKAKKRHESPSIMESPGETSKNRPDLPFVERQNQNQHDIIVDAEATDIYAKMPKKTHDKPAGKKKHFVDYNEPEENKDIQFESVKARTESLIFNSEESNDTGSSKHFIMKGTGVPTRERYKMITPDYYKKLPRIVEKYDFNEPIPEADREREVFDDVKIAVLEPAKVNKKVRQQRESVRAIMDEIGWSS